MRYEKAANLLDLALRMQASRQGLSLEEIGETYGVSRRTAERMRDAIALTFPQVEEHLDADRVKRWRLPRGFAPALASVTADELASLETATSLTAHHSTEAVARHLRTLATKLRAALPDGALTRIDPDLEALTEAEGIAMRPGPRPTIRPEVVETLRRAIKACVKVRLHYRGRTTGRASRQIVCPYGLLYGSRHYLVAYSMNPAVRDYRLYSLADIDRVDMTEWPFVRREAFSLADYAHRSFGIFQEDPVDVVWRFAPDAATDARTFRFHPTQHTEDQPDGSLLVRFRAGGMQEMCWHLFTWGGAVEVMEPPVLRRMYRAMLEEALAAAQDLRNATRR